jgi:diguanylate cyclase (GGDEF)-like protein
VTGPQSILIVGDAGGDIRSAAGSAWPGADVVSAGGVLLAAEPIERRPEAAVRTFRQLAGESRVILFGGATLEPLNRKMLEFGGDDYLITPARPQDLTHALSQPARPTPDRIEHAERLAALIRALDLSDLILESLSAHPQASTGHLVSRISQKLSPHLHMTYSRGDLLTDPTVHTVPVRVGEQTHGRLQVRCGMCDHVPVLVDAINELAGRLSRVAALEDRHVRLQKLAITDELTGLYNGRYFYRFLDRILEKAKHERFTVTLLLFDIDNFKRYNDTFGHGMGDDILRQTGAMMKRCIRDHDIVARIAGDEFAVVFWDKDGPRVPREQTTVPARVPQTPMIIAQRFRRLLDAAEFPALGTTGRGVLTISGGMAVYPFDAQSSAELYDAADRALMFHAKKGGKNAIYLINDKGSIDNHASPDA